MTARPARRAVVTLAALDMRRRPDHRAELTSQLLMGEVARVIRRSTDGHWRQVEGLADGYRGWVRDWGLVEATPARAASWARRARARVSSLFVELRGLPGAGPLVTPLFWNARVIPIGRRGRFRRVELPDGRRGWLPGSALEARGRRPGLVARVRELLGVPYLWGGRTPLGFDCSGFVQQVLAEQGVALARDAGQQYRCSRPLGSRETPRIGDLLFFGPPGRPVGHVGLGLGGGYYAHCRRDVRISSIDPSSPLHDNELERQNRGWRRPSRGLRNGPAGGPRGGEAT